MLEGNLVVIVGLMNVLTVGSIRAQDVPDSRFFEANGVRIHYIEEGSGDPVVLLHGNSGSVEQWLQSGVLQDLAEDYRVIAFDARGHGKSDKPHDVSSYGAEMALDIFRLLDHLDIERAHVLGYSMGARIVGGSMPSHPDRFLTAILGGFGPVWNWSAEDQRRVEVRSERMLANPPQQLIEEGQDVEALATLLLGFSELAVTDRELATVTIPTLAIVGSEDPNLRRIRDLGRLMPHMKVVVIEGATHSGPAGADLRAEFIEEVRAFIADPGIDD